MGSVVPYLVAIVPTIVVATFFYFIIKGMIEGDRRERLAQSKFEAEEDRRRAAADAPTTSTAEDGAGDPARTPDETPDRPDNSS